MKQIFRILCWPICWFAVAAFMFAVGVVFQYVASDLVVMQGFGEESRYDCSYCTARVRDVDGVYLPNHYFHVTRRLYTRIGNTECKHEWIMSGGGHADGAIHPWYSPLLNASHKIFIAAILIAAGSIFGLIRNITLASNLFRAHARKGSG